MGRQQISARDQDSLEGHNPLQELPGPAPHSPALGPSDAPARSGIVTRAEEEAIQESSMTGLIQPPDPGKFIVVGDTELTAVPAVACRKYKTDCCFYRQPECALYACPDVMWITKADYLTLKLAGEIE